MTINDTLILIADDHPLFRAGVKQTLMQADSLKIIETNEGNETLDCIKNQNPDIAVLDIQMPNKTGMEILETVSNERLQTKIILLTMHKNLTYFYHAISLGVKGYLLKETAADDLINAVEAVLNGNVFVSPRIEELINTEKKDRDDIKLLINSINSLTKTEKDILKLVSEWKTNSEIANQLFKSIRTIENHRANIADKLKLRGTHSLTKFAIENKELF